MLPFRKTSIVVACFLGTFAAFGQSKPVSKPSQPTICNPMNLSYRFCLDAPSRREAADPTMEPSNEKRADSVERIVLLLRQRVAAGSSVSKDLGQDSTVRRC